MLELTVQSSVLNSSMDLNGQRGLNGDAVLFSAHGWIRTCFCVIAEPPKKQPSDLFFSCLTFWWCRGGFFSECFTTLIPAWPLLGAAEPAQSCRWRKADEAVFFVFYGLVVSYDPVMAACLYLEVLGSWREFCYCTDWRLTLKRCHDHQSIVWLHSPLASCLTQPSAVGSTYVSCLTLFWVHTDSQPCSVCKDVTFPHVSLRGAKRWRKFNAEVYIYMNISAV